MRAIPQLVSAPLHPIPMAEHFRRSHPPCEHSHGQSQGEIRCFRNSEILRKPDGSNFRCGSAGRLRRETCKMKMEALFRVSAAFPLT